MQLEQFLKNHLGAYEICQDPGCGCDSWDGKVSVSRFTPGSSIEVIRHYYNDTARCIPWQRLSHLHSFGPVKPLTGKKLEVWKIGMYGGENAINGCILASRTPDGILIYSDCFNDGSAYIYLPMHRVSRIGEERICATQFAPPTATAAWPIKNK